MFTRINTSRLVLAAMIPWLAIACGDENPTGPAGNSGGTVSLSLAVQSQGPQASYIGPATFDIALNDGANTLDISRVAVVLREVELELRNDDSCDNDVAEVVDRCEKFEVGPILLELPLDGSVNQVFSITGVPAGTYDEVEFNVHKPSSGSVEDQTFIQQNPDFSEVSIRVEGQYNGTDFTYTTDLMDNQRIGLVPPLTIEAGSSPAPTNVTLRVDLTAWFEAADGSLLDPATANDGGQNKSWVDNAIKQSIDAFEDRNRDGSED
jgi:hypothetical protein